MPIWPEKYIFPSSEIENGALLPRTAITMRMMREVAVIKIGIRMSLSLHRRSSWQFV